ncbi:MAG: Wzz protein [Candidatus Brocadiaceae bacterium]|nr:Wzz protein [Candidatus Brocadiaceae bacterium]
MELRRYWEIICRRKWTLIQAIVLIPLFAYIFMNVVSPIYQSKAKLWVKLNTIRQKFISNIPAEFGRLDFIETKNALVTIEEILKSDAVIGKAIDEMGLKDKDGKIIRKNAFTNPNIVKLITQKKGVQIKLISDSEAFNIIGYSNETSEAKAIAEKVIEQFLNAVSKMYREEVEKAIKIITERMIDVESRLMAAEQAVSDYKTKNRLYNVENQTTTLISVASTMESELNSTERTLKTAKERLVAVNETLGNQPEYRKSQKTIENNPLIEDYKKQLLGLELTLAKLRTELTTEHPDVKSQINQIEAVKSVIVKEIKRTFASQNIERNSYYDELISRYCDTKIDIITNTVTIKILARQLAKKNTKLKILTAKERELTRLSKEMDNLRTIYTTFFTNLESAKAVLNMDITNAVVIQPPTLFSNLKENLRFPPENKLRQTAAVTVIGALFGIFLVFFLEYIDDRIWNSQDVENALNYKIIHSVPKVKLSDLNIEKSETSLLTDNIYTLLANMKLFKGDGFGKVISVISTAKGEGKSTLAAFVSGVLAQQGKKVVLIDGNMRDPSLHYIFNLHHKAGLANYFLHDVKIQELRCLTSIANLNVITAGTVLISNPQKYLDSDKFSELVKFLMTDHDVILLDTPAHAFGSDALLISKYAQDILFVAEQGKTPIQKAKEFMVAIERANIRVTGAVLNKVQKGMLRNFLSR